jgi:hypothetical protein
MIHLLLRASMLALACLIPLVAHAQPGVPMQSRPGPGEVDTADRRGGQAGGIGAGVGYTLPTLRCPRGAAIVGARIRRGDVLDWIQIACAQPNCANGACQWAQRDWGPAAGNPQGGDPHPEMICAATEMVSGFRARVVAFTRFDYAADIEIECSTIAGAADAQGLFPVSGQGEWHHPEGGLARGTRPGNIVRTSMTPAISCRPNGGAAAFSLGVSANFVDRNQRVVQAISLYCPAAQQQAAQCPDRLVVAAVDDQRAVIERDWLARGGLTGGGAVSTMRAEPARNWNGTQVQENVQLEPGSNRCNLPNAAALCSTGGMRRFAIGAQGQNNAIRLPGSNLTVMWTVAPADQQSSFPDSHFVLDAAGGRPIPRDLLGQNQGPCTITCIQTYSCGAAPRAVTYGPFRITYTFTHENFVPTIQGLVPLPSGMPRTVTRVQVMKQ